MSLIGEYQNGNYKVSIYDDGTKIRENDLDNLTPNFPESIDLKITNYCNMGCKYCHEDSSIKGVHGDILQNKFIDTLRPHTELAIGGGNPLSHPDLYEFLTLLKRKKVLANITVNQTHFMLNYEMLKIWSEQKLIYGLGISLTDATPSFISKIEGFPNVVIHVINGIVRLSDLILMQDKNIKLLILGYKDIRRGSTYLKDNKDVFENQVLLNYYLPTILNKFSVISFDNLAIKQLDVSRLMSKKQWNEFYMGDDGQYTMYIDLVNRQFAKSSVSKKRHNIMENIVDMFEVVRKD